ncbi:MAG: endonuclease [Solirubrobacteraceae bacterium]|nr:endonuclease [Solirubrobacteraceae bacterium]
MKLMLAAGAVIGLMSAAEHPGHRRGAGAGLPMPYVTGAARGAAIGLAAAVMVVLDWRLWRNRSIPAAAPRREAIPERVRHEVWRRDRGTCVDCGSRSRLEYDHIIPIVRGGSNTVRNLEIRCEQCNRSKGARV